MIVKEKRYLRDKVVNILLTSKETRCYTEAIISKALNIPLETVKDNLELLSPRINNNINNQYSIVDTLYENNSSLINIEVNFNNNERVQNKNMKYVCQLVLRQTKVNNKELNIKPIYQININNFDIFKKGRFVYQSYLMEKEFHMKRSELFQIIDINMDFLTKIDYTEIKKDSLEKLLFILICEDNNKLDELYVGDGIMEKVKERTLEIAKSMVKLNVSDDIIIKSTGLTKEEINELKNN